jgi:hypothetical protein
MSSNVKIHCVALVSLLSILLASCGGSDGAGGISGPSGPTYADISGTYGGGIVGNSQGVLLQGTFTLTITQTSGALGGSYSLAGTLYDGVTTLQILGTGTATGTIASGSNPSVNITAKSGVCPNVQDGFSGAYDTTNRVITLTGRIDFFNNSCLVVLTYNPTTIILRR